MRPPSPTPRMANDTRSPSETAQTEAVHVTGCWDGCHEWMPTRDFRLYRVVTCNPPTDEFSFCQNTTQPPVRNLELLDKVGSGVLYTAFEAKLDGKRVIAKLAPFATFPFDRESVDDPDYDGHVVGTALQFLLAEEAAYSRLFTHLPEACRRYVPINYGLFGSSPEIPNCLHSDVLPSHIRFDKNSIYCRIEEYIDRDLTIIEEDQPETM